MAKKLKVTIECEGKPTQVFEADGIGAVMLTDTEDSWEGCCLVCGNMSMQSLLALRNKVKQDLVSTIEEAAVGSLTKEDLLKILLEVTNNESEG